MTIILYQVYSIAFNLFKKKSGIWQVIIKKKSRIWNKESWLQIKNHDYEKRFNNYERKNQPQIECIVKLIQA